MAGSYPDVPGRRMAYDRDGTEGIKVSSSNTVIGSYTVSEMQAMNNEVTGSPAGPTDGKVVLLFPELRDVNGYFLTSVFTAGYHLNLSTSTDTTNGVDGTWTLRVANPPVASPTSPGYRNAINAVSWTGVKAVRWQMAGGPDVGIHLYGDPASGQNPDRLRLWHPTLDQEVDAAHFDWGDVARGTVLTKTFRVKNNSATLTAGSVALSSEALTDGSPTNVSAHTFSPDGSTYTSSLNIGSLAPGAISSVVTVKRDTPSNAPLSLWVTRIVASAASWT